jgi:hypothetical protein
VPVSRNTRSFSILPTSHCTTSIEAVNHIAHS